MSIVNRLKDYIQAKQIPVTQFADTCEIPRPTMSQLLNGRNKKVSDELIRKIHASYPDLSVLWLMFGEGPMYAGERPMGATTPTAPVSATVERTPPPVQQQTVEDQHDILDSEKSSIFEAGHSILFDFPTPEPMIENEIDTGSAEVITERNSDTGTADESVDSGDRSDVNVNGVPFSPASGKKIVSIIVYYSDNSFESFGPLIKQ